MDDADQHANNIKVTELMRAGRIEFANGNRKRAHVLWQQAAILCPFDVQIWKTLLDVVETTNDRRVCLENIITINPDDTLSRIQLNSLTSLREQEEMHKTNGRPSVPRSRRLRLARQLLYLGRVLLALLVMAMLFILGLFIGIALHLL